MVFIGLISYSAYLWHWPLLAFLKYGNFAIDLAMGLSVVASTLALAWLTYRFVEQPLRRAQGSLMRVFLRQYVSPAIVIGTFALFAMKTDGYRLRWAPDQYRAQLEEIRATGRPAYALDYVCQTQRVTDKQLDERACVIGDSGGGEPDVILWGDSNAAHYIGMLSVFAQTGGFAFRNVEVDSCPPLLSDPEPFVSPRRLADCRASNEVISAHLGAYETVLLAADWTSYSARSEEFLDEFSLTVHRLVAAGKRVILIGRAPILPRYDGLCWEKALSFPLIDCNYPNARLTADVRNGPQNLDRAISEIFG
jgi:hypothetical protein